MLKNITNPKKIFNENFLLFLSVFIGFRLFSLLVSPFPTAQNGILLLFIVSFVVLYFYKPSIAFIVLLSEYLLGGAGHFLEFYGLSIRTVLTLLFIVLFFSSPLLHIKFQRKEKLPPVLFFILSIFFSYLGLNLLIALSNNITYTNIIQDTIPFSVLFLIPAFFIFLKEKNVQLNLIRIIATFITGSFIFSLTNLALFSLKLTQIHGAYYKWFRDVAMGKITDMGSGFFRIVAPEHLLIPIFTIILLALLLKSRKEMKKELLCLYLMSTTVLVLNFSRAYILGVLVGIIFLKYKSSWKKWFGTVLFTVSSIMFIFFSVHILVSRGHSLGLELFSSRAESLINPQIEESTATRMQLLEPITKLIKQNPVLGNGLGSEITIITNGNEIKTRQFDWGYFELVAEIGIAGLAFLLLIILWTIKKLTDKIQMIETDYRNLYLGLLGGVVALLVINITTPAIFHTLGLLFIVLAVSISAQTFKIWEKMTKMFEKILNV